MIRVDLQLPIEASSRRGLLKKGSGILDVIQDPGVLAAIILALCTAAIAFYMNHSATVRYEDLQESVRSAVRDSARFEADIRAADSLRAKRGRIVARIASIQDIDHNRFAFVHVMDHVASALVANVWLDEISTISAGEDGNIRFSLVGFAPSVEQTRRFVAQLQTSPFLANVGLQGTAAVSMNSQEVTRFDIRASSANPDIAFLLTETIEPDGRVISDLDGPERFFVEPAPSSAGPGQNPGSTPPQGSPGIPDLPTVIPGLVEPGSGTGPNGSPASRPPGGQPRDVP